LFEHTPQLLRHCERYALIGNFGQSNPTLTLPLNGRPMATRGTCPGFAGVIYESVPICRTRTLLRLTRGYGIAELYQRRALCLGKPHLGSNVTAPAQGFFSKGHDNFVFW
jgi:hypothetical protein